MSGQHRTDHDHGGSKTNRFGDIAVFANPTIGNDGFCRHTSTPFECAQLPSARSESSFQFGDTHLAWSNTHLGRIRAPVLQINDGLRGCNIACNHKSTWHFGLEVGNHVAHTVCVPMGNINSDVIGDQPEG